MNRTLPNPPQNKIKFLAYALWKQRYFFMLTSLEFLPLLYIPPFYIFWYLEMVHNNLCDKLKLHNMTNLQPNPLLTPDYATRFTKFSQRHFKPSKHTQSSIQESVYIIVSRYE